jgi:hypothetical protein
MAVMAIMASNGGDGDYGVDPGGNVAAGGGSGGSIWINTKNLKGSGVISANGGNGANTIDGDSAGGGGGGGGRIAIYCPTRIPEGINLDFTLNYKGGNGGIGAPYAGENGNLGTLYIHRHRSTTITIE